MVEPMRAHALAMIGGIQDHRVGQQRMHARNHAANFIIDKGVAAPQHGRAVGRGLAGRRLGPQLLIHGLVFQRILLQKQIHGRQRRILLRRGQLRLIILIHPRVFGRTQRGAVRLIKGNSEEEVVLLMVLDIAQRAVGHAMAKGEIRCDAITLKAGGRLAGAQTIRVAVQFVQIALHIVPVFGIPTLGAHAVAKIIAAIQVPLANVGAAHAMAAQALTHGFHIRAQGHAVAPGAVFVREQAGKQKRTRRAANRLSRIGIFIAHALRGQRVQVGGAHGGVSVAAQHIIARGIGHNPNKLLFTH